MGVSKIVILCDFYRILLKDYMQLSEIVRAKIYADMYPSTSQLECLDVRMIADFVKQE